MQQVFEQVKKWTEQGIYVLAFRPPTTFSMVHLENNVGLYDENYIKKGIEKSGGQWIDLELSDFKTYDGSHLTINSAQKLSQLIGEEIKKLAKNN